jgi:hypothetical protein
MLALLRDVRKLVAEQSTAGERPWREVNSPEVDR